MTTKNYPTDESDDFLEDGLLSSVSTLDECCPDTKWNAEYTGPRCEKCDAPMKSDIVTVCRHCGWYASLNRFLEVDKEYEVGFEEEGQQAPQKPISHVEVWMKLLPPWAWVIIGTLVLVVVESVAVRLASPANSMFRMYWSLAQLALGAILFAGCHVFNFLTIAAEDSDTGALDMLVKPLKLWFKAWGRLPERLWMTNMAAAGLMAVAMSFLVIGGLPYERLWDWGTNKKPKQDLMAAVTSQLTKLENGNGADNLEDAVGDFAGKQALEEGDGKPTPPPKPRQKTECVIIGYRVDSDGKLASLILGTAFKNKLVYAGSLLPELDDEQMAKLMALLAEAPAKEPFLNIHADAKWVRPKYSCRVSFDKQDAHGRLTDPRWDGFGSTIVKK